MRYIDLAKYCENDPAIPNLSNFQLVTSKHYFSLESLKRAEVSVLILLEHNIHAFTIYNFLVFILGMGIVFEDDVRIIQEDGIKNVIEELNIYQKKSSPDSKNSLSNSPTTLETSREDLVSLSDKIASHCKSLLDIVMSGKC